MIHQAMYRTHKAEIKLRKYIPRVTLEEIIYNVIGTLGLNYRENELKVIADMNKRMEKLDHYNPKKVVDAVIASFEDNMKFDMTDTQSNTIKYFSELALESLYCREHGLTKTAVLDGMKSSFRGKGISIVAVYKPEMKMMYVKFLLFNVHPSIFMDGLATKIKENASISKGFRTGDVKGVIVRDCEGSVLVSELCITNGMKAKMDRVIEFVNSDRSSNIGQNMMNYCILDVVISENIIPGDFMAAPLSTLDESDKNNYLLKGFIDHLNDDGFLLDPRKYISDIADILDDIKTIQ
ncbi:MAG: hypothetical protein ACRCX2_07745 [Paraclostridium sp.]